MFKFIKSLLGEGSDKELRRIAPIVDKINAFEPTMQGCSDVELAAYTPRFKERLAAGESLDALLPEAFAVVREASQRLMALRPLAITMITRARRSA